MSASLYERVGGAEAVASIANDLVDLHAANPLIKTRFQDSDLDEVKGLLRDHLGSGIGGPEQYTGKDMVAAHRGMNLSEQEFMAALDDALKTLEKNAIGQREQEELLFILFSFRDEVLHQ